MDSNYQICSSCFQEGKKVTTSEWCWDCMEGLCEECLKYHRKQKPSRQHKLSSYDKIQNLDLLIKQYSPNCSVHSDQRITSFCATHQTLCCQSCIGLVHNKCKDITSIIEAANKDQSTTNEEVAKKIKCVEESLEIMTETIRTSLINQGEEIIQMVVKMRKEIEKHFDKLEEDLKRKLIVQHENYLKLIHKDNCAVENYCRDIENMKSAISLLPENFPLDISFVIRNSALEKLQNYNDTFTKATKQTYQLIFTPTDVMSKLETTVTSLGEIKISGTSNANMHNTATLNAGCTPSSNSNSGIDTDQCTINFIKEQTDSRPTVTERKILSPDKSEVSQRQTQFSNIPKAADTDASEDEKQETKVTTTVKITPRIATSPEASNKVPTTVKITSRIATSPEASKEHDTSGAEESTGQSSSPRKKQNTASLTHKLQLSVFGSDVVATECCYLPDGKLVFVDTTGKCLISCNDKGRQQKRVPFTQEPLDVTLYNKTRLIVAVGKEGMQVLNIPSLRSVGKPVKLNGRCTAVTHDNEHIIVAVDDKLKIVTIDGKLVRHIDHQGLVWSLSAVHQGKIYYSDFTDDDDVLHCITLDGKSIFSYKNPQLIGPTGVAVDSHGNVYVAGLSSHNVHQLTADGELLTVILTKKDGIKYPRGMAYNKDKRELLLINQDRKTVQFYRIN